MTKELRQLKISSEKVKENIFTTLHKIKNELGFINKYSIENAVTDLRDAFINKSFLDPLNNEMYFNIKRMQSINLK